MCEAEWDISYDGYYPYCTNCGYEPHVEYEGIPKKCPQCGCSMINYRRLNRILNIEGKHKKSCY